MLSGCDHAVKTPEKQKMQEPDERENRKKDFAQEGAGCVFKNVQKVK